MNKEWKTLATDLLKRFARENDTFTATQAFRWAFTQGLPAPSNPNCLGPVFKSALVTSNMVRESGSVKSDEPRAKGRRVVRYSSVVCRYHDGSPVQTRLARLVSDVNQRRMDIPTAIRAAYDYGLTGRE